MKRFYHLVQFILISFLFNIFKLIGFKNSSNLGFVIGKTLGPIVRSKSSIIKNLNRAKIKGINMIKKHLKTTKERKGGIVDKENFVHLSNLKLDQKQDKKKAVKK